VNEDWKKFILKSGGRITDGTVDSFGDAGAELRASVDAGIISDLSQFGLIAVRGADARSFLQGQLTSDLDSVDEWRSQLGAWCSPKGRVLVLFRVMERKDAILLKLPASLVEPTLERLRMYVLRAQVELEDVSDHFVRLGVSGEAAAGILDGCFGETPTSPGQVTAADDSLLVRLSGETPRYEVICGVDKARQCWQNAVRPLTPAGAAPWSLLGILAGIPEVYVADEFLPQMLNLDALDAVSFNKGCYVGQEIVARTQHLGRLKRRLYRLRVDTDDAPATGASLYEAGFAQTAEAAGQLINVCLHPDGGSAALAVIRIDAVGKTALRLGAVDGPAVEILPLPYPVDNGTH
jgi:folate-binding protein YgfZ